MPTEPIDIRVYSPSGSIDTSLIGTLSIYNQTTATFDISNVSIPYSSILQTYHYNFTTYNELHVYIGMVDF